MWMAKYIKVLEDNMEKYHDLKIRKYYLNETQKTLVIKENTENLDTWKFKMSVTQRILKRFGKGLQHKKYKNGP